MRRRLLDWLASASQAHPWRFVGAALLLAAVAGLMSAQLGFRADFTELLPDSAPEVKDLKEIENRAGGNGYLVLQVTGGTREARRAFAQEAAAVIEAKKDVVRFVEWRFDSEFLAQRALLLLPTETLESLKVDLAARILHEKKIANPLYVDLADEAPPPDFKAIEAKYAPKDTLTEYLESKKGDELYLLVKPTTTPADLDFDRKLLALVKEAVGPLAAAKWPGLKLQYTGTYEIRVQDDDTMRADLTRSGVIASLLTLAILLAVSRRVAVISVVAFPVGLGVTSTFAFAWLQIGHLNPVTGFLGAILLGLGIEYGLHLSMRYWEERRRFEPLEAMQHTLNETFGGALSSAVTNAAAFFVLVFAEFEAFKQFGRIAAFGVLATLASAYVFGPALLFLSERYALRKPKPVVANHVDPAPWRPPTFVLGAIVAAMALGVAFSLAVRDQVGFENDVVKMTSETPASRLELHIGEEMGVVILPAVVWVDSLDSARKVTQLARERQKAQGDQSTVAQVGSVNDLLPADTERRLGVMAELGAVLETLPPSKKEEPQVQRLMEMTRAQPWTLEELPIEFRRRFQPFESSGTFVLIFPRQWPYKISLLSAWASELNTLRREAETAGLHAPILDANRLVSKVFELIRKDGPLIMGLAALVVFFTIWVALRKLTHAVMVTVPLFAGMACLPGGMLLGDISLNFFNVVVMPNLLAIAVDNSVHVFHRYKAEGLGSMPRIMRYTGVTAIVATCSNATGYASMLIARHSGLRSVGLLACLGVVCTFLGTTVLFPALLELRERLLKRDLSGGRAADPPS
jgi:uncharacterized protein